MGEKHIRRSKELKFRVALEAIRGEKQLAQIAEEYQVHPQQVTQWKKEIPEKGPELFKTIGHQLVVIAWFKKKLGISELPSERP